MSTGTGTGTGTGAVSKIQGNTGIPNGSGGNPGGLPGGNNEGFGTYNTDRRIVQKDGSRSKTISSFFVYGTGGLRFWLIRNSPPGPLIFLIGGTIIIDCFGRAVQNAVNDPNYVLANIINWRTI